MNLMSVSCVMPGSTALHRALLKKHCRSIRNDPGGIDGFVAGIVVCFNLIDVNGVFDFAPMIQRADIAV